MASRLAVAATLATGCSAFVIPTGTNLRATASTESIATKQVPQASIASLAVGATSVAGVFAVAATRRTRSAKVGCQVVGVCEPLSEKFDPLGLGTEDKIERYTEAEIKHGRCAMIACLGYVLPEWFRFPGCESYESGLGALGSLPAEGWLQLVLLIGAHEILVKPREGGLGKFDFGLGTELLEGQTEAEIERKQTVERNNGRLAMVGFAGLVSQELYFGTNPITMLAKNGFWAPQYEWIVQDIPICKSGIC